MARFPLVRWLVLAALADWLITRSLARLAIFMPKSSLVLSLYQGLTWLGQLASTLAALLTLSGVVWLAWHRRRSGKGAFSAALVLALALSLFFLIVRSNGWTLLGFYLLLSIPLVWLGWDIWRNVQGVGRRLALLLPGSALLLSLLYHGEQALSAALYLPGPSPVGGALFNLGEFLAVVSPIGLWWVEKPKPRPANLPLYAWAMLPALAFSLFYWLNPSMAGILVVWSTGLTLYLPWLLYALSLWLAGVVVLKAWSEKPALAWAVLLLAAGGYTPQLSTQVFWGLIALNLLAVTSGLPAGAQALTDARAGAPQCSQYAASGETI